MALKWTGSQSESGILRKSELKEKKEDLFVFGYSCKLFRDDDKALHIDQGKHLIPWMGDETLKIDRYDARGALHELTSLEAPSGGFDVRMELTKTELEVEQLCDEERYRALHTDEDEEEMYKEEELKRLHAAGYGQVGFNYDTPAEPQATGTPQPQEVDEPFVPLAAFKALMPSDIVFPEGLKQNAIIEKTANFIASQGAQMEILIKAKQGDNPQFQFLNRDSHLHPYYVALTALIKAGKWPEKIVEVVEEKPPENEEYLHPSLASTIIESAPAIPSIHYKPSADCDYTMLISKFKGASDDDEPQGDVPPPGTESPTQHGQIYKPPVMYTKGPDGNYVDPTAPPPAPPQFAAYYHQYLAQEQARSRDSTPTLHSTGLSLMKNYNTDSDTDDTDSDSTDSSNNIPTPPEDIQTVIDKMAAYVARNGDEFADIVRARNDPRFTFLEPNDVYYAYYRRLMQQKRGDANGRDKKDKSAAPVSFSIKKLKEPDPILPKPALPYESSSEDESDKTDKQSDRQEEIKETPKVTQVPVNHMPPVVVYKMEGQFNNDLPMVKTIEPLKHVKKVPQDIPKEEKITEKPKDKTESVEMVEKNKNEDRKDYQREKENKRDRDRESPLNRDKVSPFVRENDILSKRDKQSPIPRQNDTYSRENSVKRDRSPHKREKERSKDKKGDRESPYKDRGYSKDKKKHHRKKEYRSKSETRDKRRRSVERERKEKSKKSKVIDDLENEIISLEDNSDEMIVDLTGDQSDTKECETEVEKAKQQERRRRAAEFLKNVGVDPAAALPTSSLASAMVDTLESLRKKKADEEKRLRREKRRNRERHEEDERLHRKSKRRKYRSSDENESDFDGSKKKKRKKDKKHSSKTKKKHRKELEEEDMPLPANINLTSTLKELRTSPTKQITQEIEEVRQESSEEEITRDKGRKKEREYSEGEWSSDSEGDSKSDATIDDK